MKPLVFGMDDEELAQIRRQLGLSQRALARELESSEGAIKNMSRTTEYAIRQLHEHGLELAPLTGAHVHRYAPKPVMALVKDLGLRGCELPRQLVSEGAGVLACCCRYSGGADRYRCRECLSRAGGGVGAYNHMA